MLIMAQIMHLTCQSQTEGRCLGQLVIHSLLKVQTKVRSHLSTQSWKHIELLKVIGYLLNDFMREAGRERQRIRHKETPLVVEKRRAMYLRYQREAGRSL